MNLADRLRERAYRRAEPGRPFRLASGAESEHYVDAKALTLDPDDLADVAEAMVDSIVSLGWEPDAVGGLAVGSDPLTVAVSLAARARGMRWLPLLIRKEPKSRGTGKRVEGLAPEGSRVAVLEDVATTGGSSLRAVDALAEEGLVPVGVLCLVDREEGAAEAVAARGLAFAALVGLSEFS